MKKMPTAAFHSYRYQILPVSQELQLGLDGTITSIEDLKKHKNEFFAEALRAVNAFMYPRATVIHQVVVRDADLTVLRLGVERDLQRQRRDFTTEPVEHWPDTWVAIDNRPHIQKCIIQKQGGFQHTRTVAKILEDTLNERLQHYQLACVFEPIYGTSVFWDLIERFTGRITQIEFELISPNMSNLSEALTVDLKTLTRETSTQRTRLQLNSDPKAALTPTRDDAMISGLVDYASTGGGDIMLRARGVKRKMHTAKGITEISIDEVELQGTDPDGLAKSFRKLVGE